MLSSNATTHTGVGIIIREFRKSAAAIEAAAVQVLSELFHLYYKLQ